MKIGYVRVSDEDQTQDLQIDALKAAGCEVIYGDHGVSGAKTTRKGLTDVLNALNEGDTLCVWKIDRLGRSTVHLLLLIDELHKRGVDFISVTQGIDTTTAIGRMVFGQLSVFAEYERSLISECTKAGMAAAKARGVHIGRSSKLMPEQIAYACEAYYSGKISIERLANQLSVSPSTIRRAIKPRKLRY